MSDATQTNLSTPEIDWDNYDTGGKMQAPPQAKDQSGKYITYFAKLPDTIPEEAFGNTQQGYLKVNLPPLFLVNSGPGVDGYEIRYQSLSAKKYTVTDRSTGAEKTLNASQLGNFLIAAETASMRPTDVDGYKAAVKAAGGHTVPVTLEWECYDKQTKSQVRNKYDEFEGAVGSKAPVITTADGRTLVARAKIKNFLTR